MPSITLAKVLINIPLPNSNRRIIFTATIGTDEEGKKIQHVGVIYRGKKGEQLSAGIQLDKLAKLYKQEKGKDLKYVKLVGENGVDEDGPYVQVSVIPIDQFGQSLNIVGKGTPIMQIQFYNDKVYSLYVSV